MSTSSTAPPPASPAKMSLDDKVFEVGEIAIVKQSETVMHLINEDSPTASPTASPAKMISLMSSDGKVFEVDEIAVKQSETVMHLINKNCNGTTISLPKVTGKILSMIIKYCERHSEFDPLYDFSVYYDDVNHPLKIWDADFVNVHHDVLIDLVKGADYLKIKGLLDLTCQTVADFIRGKGPEEIREIFHIVNDFSPEEEEKIRSNNSWAFKEYKCCK